MPTETERALAIPRVSIPDVDLTDELMLPDKSRVWTDRYGRTITGLRPIQSLALEALRQAQTGAFFAIGVGGGKCCTYGMEFYDPTAGKRRILGEEAGNTVAVVTKNQEGKILRAPATAFSSGQKECLRLTLASGVSTEISLDHPVYTHRGWVSAGELRDDDLVATPRHYPEPEQPLVISDEEVAFLAYMMGDGSCHNMPTFTNNCRAILDDFKVLAGAVSEEYPPHNKTGVAVSYLRPNNVVGYNVRGVTRLLDRWGLRKRCTETRMPPAFYGLPSHQIALFLNRFWACDGTFGVRRTEVALASEKLIDDLQFFLRRLGIYASKKYKESTYPGAGRPFDAWRLTVSGKQDLLRFFETVGYPVGKEAKARALHKKMASARGNTNYDVVPLTSGPEYMAELAEGTSWRRTKIRKRLGLTPGQWVGRKNFESFVRESEYLGKFSSWATNDLYWEKIRTVERTGLQDVYDLSVPGTENFVGDGIVLHNSGICGLAGTVLNKKLAIILAPARTVPQLRATLADWGQHFRLPRYRVESYAQLSRPREQDLLPAIIGDVDPKDVVIVCDEMHRLKHHTSARTKRVVRLFMAAPELSFVGLSGTITSASLKDFSHLMELALREGAPMPLDCEKYAGGHLHAWAEVIDVKGQPDHYHWQKINPLLREFGEGPVPTATGKKREYARRAFQARLKSAPGVVVTSTGAFDGSLLLSRIRGVPIPGEIQDAFKSIADGELPNGDPIMDDIGKWRAYRQASAGFTYFWDWPGGEVDWEWLDAKRNWEANVREELKKFSKEGYDSPALVEWDVRRRMEEGKRDSMTQALEAWNAQRHKPPPPTVPHWHSDYLVQDAVKRARSLGEPVLVWYETQAMAEALRPYMPVYGAGDEVPLKVETCAVSIRAQGEGLNLQDWRLGLVLEPPSSGQTWEQLLGRTHRPGQLADEVECYMYGHTPYFAQAIDTSMEKAWYIEHTTGNEQKLCFGTWV